MQHEKKNNILVHLTLKMNEVLSLCSNRVKLLKIQPFLEFVFWINILCGDTEYNRNMCIYNIIFFNPR